MDSYLNTTHIARSTDGVEYHPLVPFLPENSEVRVTGNFQEKQIKGKLFMKGRIHLIVIAGAVLRLLPDKNIRQLIFGLLKKRKQK